jgi:hypothetical protein
MTDMTPTPEFREACRAVLGGDGPATVLGAIARGDQRIGEVREMHRRLVDATTAEERKEVVESLHKRHEAVRESIRQGLRDGLTRGEIEEQMIEDEVGPGLSCRSTIDDWIAVLAEFERWQEFDLDHALYVARKHQVTDIVDGMAADADPAEDHKGGVG